jgi:hypothetical protein
VYIVVFHLNTFLWKTSINKIKHAIMETGCSVKPGKVHPGKYTPPPLQSYICILMTADEKISLGWYLCLAGYRGFLAAGGTTGLLLV